MQPHHCHSCLSRTYDPWCVKCGCKTAPIIQAKKKVRFVADPFSDKLRAVITEPDEWPSEPGTAQKKRKPFTKYGSLNTNFAAPFIRQLRREIDLQGHDDPQGEWLSVKELLLP